MVTLFITNKNKQNFQYQKFLEKIAKNILANEKVKGRSEINLIITNNHQMQILSNKYKQKNAPTDVLSFPTDYQKYTSIIGYNMLGDIFISSNKVKTQAQEYGHSTKREWAYLFAHGLLHLLGYDHEDLKAEKEMHNKINTVLTKLGVTRDEKFF